MGACTKFVQYPKGQKIPAVPDFDLVCFRKTRGCKLRKRNSKVL